VRGRIDLVTGGALALALSLPLLLLHSDYQPSTSLSAGGTSVDLRLADLAVIVTAVVALLAGRRYGFAPLRAALPLWIAGGIFLAIVFAACFYPVVLRDGYPWKTHLVTAIKYAEYAVLALVVPLVLRGRRQAELVAWALIAVCVAADVVALVQFSGVDILAAAPAGARQPSFLGYHDYAAVAGATLSLGVAALAFVVERRDRSAAWIAGAAGLLGVLIAAAAAAVIGVLLAIGAAGLLASRARRLDLRRGLALAGVAVVVAGGYLVMRGTTLERFVRFLGAGQRESIGGVESYSQRWVLDYIGLRIFVHHPVLGAGWHAGDDEATYGRELAAAHRRFPGQPAEAFPSPAHPWGIQNAYIEALAELGIVGFAAFAALIVTGLALGGRASLRAPPRLGAACSVGLLWLLVACGVWNGLWFIAGIPFDAVIWLGFGLIAAAASATRALE
jgi:O-antigen ligase